MTSMLKRALTTVGRCPLRAAPPALLAGTAEVRQLRAEVEKFDATLPLGDALTLPSAYYTAPAALALERSAAVFGRSWLHVGHSAEVSAPGSFVTRDLLGSPVVVVRGEAPGGGEAGPLHAHFNVCSHHAMPVARGDGGGGGGGALPRDAATGRLGRFVCPYHGWEYLADGRLAKARSVKGMANFRNKDYGLKPLRAAEIGGLVFVSMDPGGSVGGGGSGGGDDSLASLSAAVSPLLDAVGAAGGGLEQLRFVARKEFELACNWKVFADNYLDGGYHIPYAHPGLDGGVDMGTYASEVLQCGNSLQTVAAAPAPGAAEAGDGSSSSSSGGGGGGDGRLGESAAYGFCYPNLMLNRYGPWLDTNTIYPTGPTSCRVVFDYFLEEHEAAKPGAAHFIAESLQASEGVQDEDEMLCLGVQGGLGSAAYDQGRYNPQFEAPMYAFHRRLRRAYDEELRVLEGSETDC